MAGQNHTESSAPTTKLCSVCLQFYGKEATDYLCSKCFKEKAVKEVKLTRTSSKTAQAEPVDATSTSKLEEVKENHSKTESLEEQPASKQEKDSSRCFTCSKKVGILGFKCQCESTFCRNHRMPELHACTFDFGKTARDKLIKENFVVKAEKVVKF